MPLTIREIMREYGVCRQTILWPIYKGRLKAKKKTFAHTSLWLINRSDFETYRKTRYNHSLREIDGKLIFDKEKGLYSAREVADLLGCHLQRIYYHLRVGLIPSKRVGAAWVVHIDDINQYKSKLNKSKKNSRCPYKQIKKIYENKNSNDQRKSA